MTNRIFVILLLLISTSGTSKASPLEASLIYKIKFEKHDSAPADVVVAPDGSTGVYDAFSGSYLTYNRNGKSVDSVQKDFLKGGNCFVKSGDDYLYCNNTGASLDLISGNFEKKASFKLPPEMKGKYDPTDALVAKGYIYSVDNDNHRIIKTNPASMSISLSAGGYGQSKLSFWYPYSLSTDFNEIIYVSEVMNTRIQKITGDLRFKEFIGKWGIKGGQFYRPTGIALYKGRTILVADGYLGIIQSLDTGGRFMGLITDASGRKLELGSITHIRIKGNILAVVDAFNKAVYVYTLKEQ